MAGPARPEPPGAHQALTSDLDEASDAELLARHVAGDQAAFGLLVRRHRDRLWALAVRTLSDREEAADALQDALVSALRAAHTFQGRAAVTTWLHRIVVNACLDRARRAGSRRAGSLDEEPGRLDSLVPAAEPAEALVLRQELRRELGAALAGLPADQRAALVLVDMQGYPVAEAAELLGVPVGTVKSRCARGRARLLPLVRHLRPQDRGDHVSRETQPRETQPREAAPREAPPDVSRETSPGPRPGNPSGAGSVPSQGSGIPTQDPSLEGDATPR
ncbi:RNA polymerase sigma-70 factor (ECF subfamily) [Kitasatospora sp. GAS204A]|uniref:RNA polymerase sigma factor SigM n=1 Tax=unclassified Kitasatospora TaxID=2633591 RepID=UPI002475768C|nr:RNA polymerase sigma factor SigM [Kitasatospora sp. GAS204B]MDH6119677.1 RNA polymerase sigma-70 factor (ECF subfamily) [Kitasatospora sp. GAS204B]